jgi:tetratricopeptide (TPR) repeat protein
MARAHALAGAPELSVPLLERLLAMMEADLGRGHASIAPVLGSLTAAERQVAGKCWRKRDAVAAETHLVRALSFLRRRDGDAHPGVAGLLRELALTAEKQGHTDSAVKRLAAAVTVLRRSGDSPGLVLALEDLSDLHSVLGHAAEAEALMKEALVLASRLLGHEHAKLARLLEHLGVLLDTAGQPARARLAYEKALERWIAKLGDAHPLVAIRRAHLASRLAAGGELDRARRLAGQAFDALTVAQDVDPELVAMVRDVKARVSR